jgi:hypothetical protein
MNLKGSIAAALLLTAPLAAAAGPLDPPAGPVSPTLKTLVEVEPRRIIVQPPLPQGPDALIVITEPGSYYLGSNLSAGGSRHGVRITASNVTLDLNGFTIVGFGPDGPGRSGVIADSGGLSGISIQAFDGAGVGGAFEGALVEGVRVSSGGSGVALSQGSSPRGVCRGCTFILLRTTAVVLGDGSVIEGNVASYLGTPVMPPAINAGPGSRIAGNVLRSAPSIGIVAATGCTVEGNQIYQCAQDAIQVNGNGLASVIGNTIYSAGVNIASGAGIRLGTAGVHVEGNVVMNCDVGIVSTGGNCIVRNSLRANPTPLQTGATDLVGPTVNPAGAAGATNPLCNLVY